MSRITIDLRKRAKERIHYDLSRHTADGEDGLYCYQMSHLRFRDIITGGKSMPRNVGMPRASSTGNPETVITDARVALVPGGIRDHP